MSASGYPLASPLAPVRLAPAADVAGDLYARHGARVYRFCRRFLNRDAAEDAAHATLIAAIVAQRTGLDPDAEPGWLFELADGICRAGTYAAQPSFRALAALPPELRRPLRLRAAGRAYAEIAHELGIARPEAERLVFLARVAAARPGSWSLSSLLSLLKSFGAVKLTAVAAVSATTAIVPFVVAPAIHHAPRPHVPAVAPRANANPVGAKRALVSPAHEGRAAPAVAHHGPRAPELRLTGVPAPSRGIAPAPVADLPVAAASSPAPGPAAPIAAAPAPAPGPAAPAQDVKLPADLPMPLPPVAPAPPSGSGEEVVPPLPTAPPVVEPAPQPPALPQVTAPELPLPQVTAPPLPLPQVTAPALPPALPQPALLPLPQVVSPSLPDTVVKTP
jgi:hypothetical protein